MSGKFLHIYINPRSDFTREQIEEKLNLALDWYRYSRTNWIVYTSSDVEVWYSRLKIFVISDSDSDKESGAIFIAPIDIDKCNGFMSKSLWSWLRKKR